MLNLRGLAHLRDSLDLLVEFLLGGLARACGLLASGAGGFGALLRRLRFAADTFDLVLAGSQLHSEPGQFRASRIALQRRHDSGLAHLHLPRGNLLEPALGVLPGRLGRLKSGLRFARLPLQAQRLRFERPQLTLHDQRAGLRRTPAGDRASLIAGAIGRQEVIRGIFARQAFGGFGVFHQESGLQARQKLFCRRTERVAKFDQAVQARDQCRFGRKRHDRLILRGQL